jgi:hypothetical protein
MARNLTVSIDAKTWYEIRVVCAQRGQTVARFLADFLQWLPEIKYVRHFPLPGQRPLPIPSTRAQNPCETVKPTPTPIE